MTTKTELLNNVIVVATKLAAPFYTWDWVPSGTGAAVLTYKRYEDDVLVYTSGAINGTVEAVVADTTAPTISSATVENANPSKLVVVFSEVVTITDVTGLTIAGAATPTLSAPTGSGTNTLSFTLSAPLTNGQTVTLEVAGTNNIIDAASNALVATSQAITNNVAAAGAITYDALLTFDKTENPTYAGSSIQICDINGTNMLDIGFSGDELDIAAINAFAVSKYLNKIYDKSGNNNHLEYTTGTRPIVKSGAGNMLTQGGKPAVKFQDASSKMFAPATLTGENGLSIFLVHYNDTTSGTSKGMYGKWNGSPGSEYVLSSRGSSAPNEVILSTKNSSDAQANIFTGVSLTTKKLRLFTVLNDTTNSYTRIDGIDKGSSAGAIRAADAMLQVGGFGGSDNNEAMFFSEMRIKKGYIADFASVESSLIAKYGIV